MSMDVGCSIGRRTMKDEERGTNKERADYSRVSNRLDCSWERSIHWIGDYTRLRRRSQQEAHEERRRRRRIFAAATFRSIVQRILVYETIQQ
eukprot:scaffold52067_cov35-Attheya_sp.AAC.1